MNDDKIDKIDESVDTLVGFPEVEELDHIFTFNKSIAQDEVEDE